MSFAVSEMAVYKVTLYIIFGLCLPSCWLSRQYYYVSKLLTWAEAQQNCREQYTDLATFDSMDDIKSLKRPASIGGFVWIGLMDDPKTWKGIMGNASTSWRWSSTGKTSKSGYESWALGEPNKLVGEYCVELVESGVWLDLPCTALIPSVCFNGTDESMTYVYNPTWLRWSDAQVYCREHYTDLATIESADMNGNVSSLVPWLGAVWTGLYRIPFAWSDQSQSTFRNWAWLKPDDWVDSQTCVVEDPLHLWYDVGCYWKLSSICYGPDLVVSRVTVLRMTIGSDTDLTDPLALRELQQQLSAVFGQNRTDIKLWLKIEPTNLEREKPKQPLCT